MTRSAHPDITSVSSTQLFETDAAFHKMCAEFSDNAFFVQAIQHQNRLRRLLEFGSYANSRRVQDWCREHVAIIEALAMRDFNHASAKMRLHLEHALATAPSAQKDG
jgi:DNA-binding GntR family transcriptional regulator